MVATIFRMVLAAMLAPVILFGANVDRQELIATNNNIRSTLAIASNYLFTNYSAKIVPANQPPFSIAGNGSDQSVGFSRLRSYLRTNDGCTVVFTNGFYSYTNNLWLSGIKNVTVDGNGSWFTNIGNGTYDFERAALYVNLPLLSGQLDDNAFSSPATTSSPIATVSMGYTNITLSVANDTNRFSIGMPILIYGFSQQAGKDNPRYFEYNEVANFASGGVIILKRATRYNYDSRWFDLPASVLPLWRANYVFGENIVLRRMKFGASPNLDAATYGTSTAPGAVYAVGARNIIIEDCDMFGFVPAHAGEVIVRNSRITGYNEPDKILDTVVFDDHCELGEVNQASGVNHLLVLNSIVRNYFQAEPRYLNVRNSQILATEQAASQILLTDARATRMAAIENCTFYQPSNTLYSLINCGGTNRFTNLVSTAANEIQINHTAGTNFLYTSVLSGIDIGTRLHQSGGTNDATITNIICNSSNLVIQGTWGTQPTGGDIFYSSKVREVRLVNPVVQPWGSTFTSVFLYGERPERTIWVGGPTNIYVLQTNGVSEGQFITNAHNSYIGQNANNSLYLGVSQGGTAFISPRTIGWGIGISYDQGVDYALLVDGSANVFIGTNIGGGCIMSVGNFLSIPVVTISSNLWVTGGVHTAFGYYSSDDTAGATATTGGANFKNGLYTGGTITGGGGGATNAISTVVTNGVEAGTGIVALWLTDTPSVIFRASSNSDAVTVTAYIDPIVTNGYGNFRTNSDGSALFQVSADSPIISVYGEGGQSSNIFQYFPFGASDPSFAIDSVGNIISDQLPLVGVTADANFIVANNDAGGGFANSRTNKSLTGKAGTVVHHAANSIVVSNDFSAGLSNRIAALESGGATGNYVLNTNGTHSGTLTNQVSDTGLASMFWKSAQGDTNGIWFELDQESSPSGLYVRDFRTAIPYLYFPDSDIGGADVGVLHFQAPTNLFEHGIQASNSISTLGDGVAPGHEEFYSANGNDRIAIGSDTNAVGTNFLLISVGAYSTVNVGDVLKVYSKTTIGPTNVIVLTNGSPQTSGVLSNLASNPYVAYTNPVTKTSSTVSGAGSGSTNYLISLSTNALNDFWLGSSNVNIYTVSGSTLGSPIYWTAIVTNLSSDTWGLSFASGTNRWKFAGVYGTNAPTVLTNNTALMLSGRTDGTNCLIGYTYFAPGL